MKAYAQTCHASSRSLRVMLESCRSLSCLGWTPATTFRQRAASWPRGSVIVPVFRRMNLLATASQEEATAAGRGIALCAGRHRRL
jgi:hypothetical protein